MFFHACTWVHNDFEQWSLSRYLFFKMGKVNIKGKKSVFRVLFMVYFTQKASASGESINVSYLSQLVLHVVNS